MRRLFQWQKPVSWDVAVVRRRARRQGGGGAPRLGRRCPASARDLLGLRVDWDSHLNA